MANKNPSKSEAGSAGGSPKRAVGDAAPGEVRGPEVLREAQDRFIAVWGQMAGAWGPMAAKEAPGCGLRMTPGCWRKSSAVTPMSRLGVVAGS